MGDASLVARSGQAHMGSGFIGYKSLYELYPEEPDWLKG
jgi:hypothetical protein